MNSLLRMNVVETWFVAVRGLCWCNFSGFEMLQALTLPNCNSNSNSTPQKILIESSSLWQTFTNLMMNQREREFDHSWWQFELPDSLQSEELLFHCKKGRVPDSESRKPKAQGWTNRKPDFWWLRHCTFQIRVNMTPRVNFFRWSFPPGGSMPRVVPLEPPKMPKRGISFGAWSGRSRTSFRFRVYKL